MLVLMFVIKDTTSRALTLARVEERRTTGATLAPRGTIAALLVIIVIIVIIIIITRPKPPSGGKA